MNVSRLEQQENFYWNSYYINASQELSNRLGIHIKSINGADCYALSKADILAFNRVICIGTNNEEVTIKHIDEIKQFYKSAGSNRFFIQVSPVNSQKDIINMLEANGFRHHNNWAKFYKKLDQKFDISENSLTIRKVEKHETSVFNNIISDVFEFENDAGELFTAPLCKPEWTHYFAMDSNKAISAASIFIKNKFASLAIAGTLPEYRGKGAQSALIATRINKAIDMGCEYIVVETAEDTLENPSPSFRNMKRIGFELAYIRPNYVYKFE